MIFRRGLIKKSESSLRIDEEIYKYTMQQQNMVEEMYILQQEVQKRVDQKHQELFTQVLEKIGQATDIALSQHIVLCIAEDNPDLLYFSSESPDVTQWLIETVNGKTSSAPDIGSAPQKIARMNYEALQPHVSKKHEAIDRKIERIMEGELDEDVDTTDTETEKTELQKMQEELNQLDAKVKSSAAAFACEGGYMFVVRGGDEVLQTFPNAVDITEKVLIKMNLKYILP